MADVVKIVECPRDAWQGLKGHIPAERKAAYLRRLVEAGFRHMDAVSFVSPRAVPQMADSGEVLRLLGPVPGVEVIGIVVNAQGAERAIAAGTVTTLGFPYSISASFLGRNQRQTPQEALLALQAIHRLAARARVNLVAYVSMAFGNPYGDPWSVMEVVRACETLESMGIRTISLADTVGVATTLEVMEVVGEVVAEHEELEIGVHLHARRDAATDHVKAAFAGGCRRFDGAMGGLGGCPFAQDALVGNVATETIVATLAELGAVVPRISGWNELLKENAAIAHAFEHAHRRQA